MREQIPSQLQHFHPSMEAEAAAGMEEEWWSKKRAVVCVMDSSGQLGSTLVQRLLQTGYAVHAAALHNYTPHFHGEMQFLEGEGLSCCHEKKKKKRLRVSHSDQLDYHSILDALKRCSALFYCFEPPPDHPIYDESMVELEVRAAHNVMEACAQTETIHKVVLTSSATAVFWRDGCNTMLDIDERNWSDTNFCKKFKLWHGLSKMLAEKTAWALAMDRGLNMVSMNRGLLMGPPPDRPMTVDNPYLKGAAEMYEDGVFVTVDLSFLVDAHICIFKDVSPLTDGICASTKSSTPALLHLSSPACCFSPLPHLLHLLQLQVKRKRESTSRG